MSTINPSEDVYFKMACDFLVDNKEWYLKRFAYAACELWLCAEICNILNFDHASSFSTLASNKFCFNEDAKRDLTVYDSQTGGVLSHIEVKLLYPGYSLSKRASKITELFSKIEGNKQRKVDSGWFFIIWISTNCRSYKTSEAFFDDAFSEIKYWMEKSDVDYCLSEYGMIDVIGDHFLWRNEEKEVIVKAIAINRN